MDIEFLKQYVGVAGITLIRAIVADYNPKTKSLKVLASLVLGVAINVAAALIFSTDLLTAVIIGLFVGLLSNGYSDLKSLAK